MASPTDPPAPTAQHPHVPVLLGRVVELLSPALGQPGSVLVDATVGLGGHAEAMLRACPSARVVGLDRDPEALDRADRRLAPFAGRYVGAHAVYDQLDRVLDSLGIASVQAILFDLGVSSLQLDDAGRGFSYRMDAPLDMRMDQSTGLTAAEVLNTYDESALAQVLRVYGEERFARRIARAVVRSRQEQPFDTSARLVGLVHDVVPARSQRSGGHPAKRTFQALRIEVNAELSAWSRTLPAALDRLAVQGRVAVLSYHSLEDRITKSTLVAAASSGAPPGVPVERAQDRPWMGLLTRGAERAGAPEISSNSRAASVRLRAAERIRQGRHGLGPSVSVPVVTSAGPSKEHRR